MDAPDVDPYALEHALKDLEWINRLLNGYDPSIKGLADLLPKNTRKFSMLDVGCGNGDTLRQVAKWARMRGVQAELRGIELSGVSASSASRACSDFPEIKIDQEDVFSVASRCSYDVVHCALVLHHFSSDAEAVKLLCRMSELSRYGVIVNDLHRHWFAYYSIGVLTRIFSRSAIIHNDAPLSVARAFTRVELSGLSSEAGLQGVSVSWHWAFRWLLTARTGEQRV